MYRDLNVRLSVFAWSGGVGGAVCVTVASYRAVFLRPACVTLGVMLNFDAQAPQQNAERNVFANSTPPLSWVRWLGGWRRG